MSWPRSTVTWPSQRIRTSSSRPPARTSGFGAAETTGPQDKPVVALIRRLLDSAVRLGAREVHLEGVATGLAIRMRVDGMLADHLELPSSWARPLFARLKVQALLDVAVDRLPQEGEFQAVVRGRRLDVRFATVPTLAGEDAVLHLTPYAGPRGLAGLGLEPGDLGALKAMTESGGGLLVVTGPRESGRATTARALLAHASRPDQKVLTVEGADCPPLEGATQVRVNPRLGLGYARGVQAALTQDPDVLLIGSIEDAASAGDAVRAALDGRLVLACLNTQGTAEAIERLLDLGIEPHALAEGLRGVVAQRLVRTVCRDCAEPIQPEQRNLERLGMDEREAGEFLAGVGCDTCRGTGFRGRTGIFEFLSMDGATAQMLRWGVAADELHEAAVEAGLVTLAADGARKARAGRTTLSEVLRVTAGGTR